MNAPTAKPEQGLPTKEGTLTTTCSYLWIKAVQAMTTAALITKLKKK